MKIGGIDIGTSGVKCAVYNENGKLVSFSRKTYSYSKIERGYCLDAEEVWRKTKEALREVTIACNGEIDGLAVSTIGEACVLIDAHERVLAPSILYNDKRGMEESCQYRSEFGNDLIYKVCGVRSNGTYSLEKLKWIADHEKYYEKTKFIFLFEDYISWCLTGERRISESLASRTMGFDIERKGWWEEVFKFAGVEIDKMSKVQKSGDIIGPVKRKIAVELGLKTKTIVFSGGHDHSCCTLGAGMIYKDISTNISGSGDTISYLIESPSEITNRAFCCAPYTVERYYTTYGLCAMSGTMLKWYRNTFFGDVKEFYQKMEKKVSECDTDVIAFPGFSALGTPDFCLNMTGTLDGLTLKTTAAEIYRALLESIVFHLKMNQELLARNINIVRTVGGGSYSNVWNQMKADILDKEVQTIVNNEAGTAGAASLAGIGLGIYKTEEEAVQNLVQIKNNYVPFKTAYYKEKYQKFLELYKAKIQNVEEKKC